MKKQKVVLRSAQELANQIEAKKKRAADITPEQAVAELKAKYPDDAKVIDENVIDARQSKIAEKVDKINDLKQPKAEAPQAEAPKPKKEKGPTMAGIMDAVLAQGPGSWESIIEKVTAEAAKLKVSGKVTKGVIASHFKFRKDKQSKEWTAKLEATAEGITVK